MEDPAGACQDLPADAAITVLSGGCTPSCENETATMTDFRRFPKLQHWIDEKIASGHYFCVEEVILDALWRFRASEMTPDERREELRTEIQLGIDQADRGELID